MALQAYLWDVIARFQRTLSIKETPHSAIVRKCIGDVNEVFESPVHDGANEGIKERTGEHTNYAWYAIV